MLTPELATLRARIGAYALHAKHDPRITTQNARAAFLQKFIDQVDPDGVLPEAERLRRAEAARRAYFAALAFKSAKSRVGRPARSRRASGSVATSTQEAGDA